MNQTIITGNLTADIETREIKNIKTGGGTQHLSKFTFGCNEGERVSKSIRTDFKSSSLLM